MKRLLLLLSILSIDVYAEDKSLKKPGGSGEVTYKGSNGEVRLSIEEYLNKIYQNTQVYADRIMTKLVPVLGRSGGNVRTATLDLRGKQYEYIVVILDQNRADELKYDIKGVKVETNGNKVFLHIPVKNVKNKVVITDKKDQKLIEYTILK